MQTDHTTLRRCSPAARFHREEHAQASRAWCPVFYGTREAEGERKRAAGQAYRGSEDEMLAGERTHK